MRTGTLPETLVGALAQIRARLRLEAGLRSAAVGAWSIAGVAVIAELAARFFVLPDIRHLFLMGLLVVPALAGLAGSRRRIERREALARAGDVSGERSLFLALDAPRSRLSALVRQLAERRWLSASRMDLRLPDSARRSPLATLLALLLAIAPGRREAELGGNPFTDRGQDPLTFAANEGAPTEEARSLVEALGPAPNPEGLATARRRLHELREAAEHRGEVLRALAGVELLRAAEDALRRRDAVALDAALREAAATLVSAPPSVARAVGEALATSARALPEGEGRRQLESLSATVGAGGRAGADALIQALGPLVQRSDSAAAWERLELTLSSRAPGTVATDGPLRGEPSTIPPRLSTSIATPEFTPGGDRPAYDPQHEVILRRYFAWPTR